MSCVRCGGLREFAYGLADGSVEFVPCPVCNAPKSVPEPSCAACAHRATDPDKWPACVHPTHAGPSGVNIYPDSDAGPVCGPGNPGFEPRPTRAP